MEGCGLVSVCAIIPTLPAADDVCRLLPTAWQADIRRLLPTAWQDLAYMCVILLHVLTKPHPSITNSVYG